MLQILNFNSNVDNLEDVLKQTLNSCEKYSDCNKILKEISKSSLRWQVQTEGLKSLVHFIQNAFKNGFFPKSYSDFLDTLQILAEYPIKKEELSEFVHMYIIAVLNLEIQYRNKLFTQTTALSETLNLIPKLLPITTDKHLLSLTSKLIKKYMHHRDAVYWIEEESDWDKAVKKSVLARVSYLERCLKLFSFHNKAKDTYIKQDQVHTLKELIGNTKVNILYVSKSSCM